MSKHPAHLERYLTRRGAVLGAAGLTLTAFAALVATRKAQAAAQLQSWPLNTPALTGIHDLAPARDGGVWFTAQRSGHLGWFDPKTGQTELIKLGNGSAPHGVIQGPDKAAWITDSGLNAIVRVGWPDRQVRRPGPRIFSAEEVRWNLRAHSYRAPQALAARHAQPMASMPQ